MTITRRRSPAEHAGIGPTRRPRTRHQQTMRKFQHIYGYPLLSVMYWLWRFHSAQDVVARRDYKEGALLAANYLWLATCMPWQVAVGSVFLSGFLVGALVSATHQSEEIMLKGDQPDFITGQFLNFLLVGFGRFLDFFQKFFAFFFCQVQALLQLIDKFFALLLGQ